jgi:hypothetical protein
MKKKMTSIIGKIYNFVYILLKFAFFFVKIGAYEVKYRKWCKTKERW